MRPEGLYQWKIPIEPATFRLVAQCLNVLHYCVPTDYTYVPYKCLCQVDLCTTCWCSGGTYYHCLPVTEMVQVDAVEEEMHQICRMLWGNSASCDHRGWQERIELSQTNKSWNSHKLPLFLGLTIRRHENIMDGDWSDLFLQLSFIWHAQWLDA